MMEAAEGLLKEDIRSKLYQLVAISTWELLYDGCELMTLDSVLF